MPLPGFREDGWLPAGHWPASWEEVAAAFGGEPGSPRAALLGKLLAWKDEVRDLGMKGRLILDGSFVSSKPNPGDVDAILLFDENTEKILREIPAASDLLSHNSMKQRRLGDLFVFAESTVRRFPDWCRLDGFDIDTR